MRKPVDHLPAGRFFGHNERLLKEQGFTLSEVRYTPGQKVPPHGHQLAYFCLLMNGGYWEQYGRRRVDYAPQSIVFHPPGDEEEDYEMDVWAGVLPLQQVSGKLIADPRLSAGIAIPDYLNEMEPSD